LFIYEDKELLIGKELKGSVSRIGVELNKKKY